MGGASGSYVPEPPVRREQLPFEKKREKGCKFTDYLVELLRNIVCNLTISSGRGMPDEKIDMLGKT